MRLHASAAPQTERETRIPASVRAFTAPSRSAQPLRERGNGRAPV